MTHGHSSDIKLMIVPLKTFVFEYNFASTDYGAVTFIGVP